MILYLCDLPFGTSFETIVDSQTHRPGFSRTLGDIARGRAIMTVLALAILSFGFGPRVSATDKDVVETVIAGIEGNYSHSPKFNATIDMVVERRNVKKSETVRVTSPTGVTATFTVSPRSAVRRRVIVSGTSLRVDTDSENSQSGEPAETLISANGSITDYLPTAKLGWIRRPNGLPPFLDLDPRCIGVPDSLAGWGAFLHQCNVEHTEILSSGKAGGTVAIEARDIKRKRVRLLFSSSHDLLPSTISYYHDDGTLNTVTTVAYQRLEMVGAWFPKEACRFLYPQPGVAREVGDPNWTEKLTITIQSIVPNVRLPESIFELQFPTKVAVTDVIHGRRYIVGRDHSASASDSGRWSRLWLWGNIGLLLSVVCLLLARRTIRRLNNRAR
jgi:hypothetical protein